MKYKFRYLISIFICLQPLTLCAEGENPSCPLLETGTPLAFAWLLTPAQIDIASFPITLIKGSEEETPQKPRPRGRPKNSLKARAAVFEPTDNKIRRTDGEWWEEYSGEYNRYFHPQWSFFINGAFARKHNSYLIPVTLGINARLGRVSFWHPYIGLGIGAVYGRLHHKSGGGLAALAQGGMEFDLGPRVFLDLFGAYRWNWFHLNSTRKHILAGGWNVGAGLGVRF